jgi:hypothetical protein
MRLTKTLVAAAVASTALTSTAIAGGLAVEVVEPPVVVIDPPAATRSSWGIILPIAAVALLIALAGS